VHDARGASRGLSHSPARDVSPSETAPPGTPNPNPNPKPLVHPPVSPRKPPRFPPETPVGVRVQLYPRDLERFHALVRKFAKSGQVASTGIDLETGKRVGGRPPVASEAFRALLDNAEGPPRRPRASKGPERVRRVDDAARVGFGRLFRPFPTRLLPYRPSVERVVTQSTGADRPQRRIEATIGFCERRLIAPFAVGDGRPTRLDLVLPTMVLDLYYGWGPVIYQTTLDGDGSVAG
jgi:hypothetical protein